jgi:hypothetical protein
MREIASANFEISFEASFGFEPLLYTEKMNLIYNDLYLNFNIWYYTHV